MKWVHIPSWSVRLSLFLGIWSFTPTSTVTTVVYILVIQLACHDVYASRSLFPAISISESAQLGKTCPTMSFSERVCLIALKNTTSGGDPQGYILGHFVARIRPQ